MQAACARGFDADERELCAVIDLHKLKLRMPEAPLDNYLENFSKEEIWQLGFKEGLIAYELAIKKYFVQNEGK